jgi:leader peptidase (prepilin peptidase)/N-methyltransferase
MSLDLHRRTPRPMPTRVLVGIGFGAVALVLAGLAVASIGVRDELVGLFYLAAVTPLLWRADLDEHRLPNAIVLPGLVVAVVGVAFGWIRTGHPSTLGVASAIAVGLFLLVLSAAGGLGMGDVKLGVLLGLCAGCAGILPAVGWLAIAFIAAGVAALGLIATRGGAERLAFGPFMLTGFWASIAMTALAA